MKAKKCFLIEKSCILTLSLSLSLWIKQQAMWLGPTWQPSVLLGLMYSVLGEQPFNLCAVLSVCIPFSLSQGAAWSAWLLAVKMLQCTGWSHTATQGVGQFCSVHHCSYTSRTFSPDHQMTGLGNYKTYLLALFCTPCKIQCILQCAKQEGETPVALWASPKSFLYYSMLLQWILYSNNKL